MKKIAIYTLIFVFGYLSGRTHEKLLFNISDQVCAPKDFQQSVTLANFYNFNEGKDHDRK